MCVERDDQTRSLTANGIAKGTARCPLLRELPLAGGQRPSRPGFRDAYAIGVVQNAEACDSSGGQVRQGGERTTFA